MYSSLSCLSSVYRDSSVFYIANVMVDGATTWWSRDAGHVVDSLGRGSAASAQIAAPPRRLAVSSSALIDALSIKI